jgi:hypothetical protein
MNPQWRRSSFQSPWYLHPCLSSIRWYTVRLAWTRLLVSRQKIRGAYLSTLIPNCPDRPLVRPRYMEANSQNGQKNVVRPPLSSIHATICLHFQPAQHAQSIHRPTPMRALRIYRSLGRSPVWAHRGKRSWTTCRTSISGPGWTKDVHVTTQSGAKL